MRWWRFLLLLVAALIAAAAGTLLTIAINVATGGTARRLPFIEHHPWRWTAGATLAVASAALLAWWTQRFYERGPTPPRTSAEAKPVYGRLVKRWDPVSSKGTGGRRRGVPLRLGAGRRLPDPRHRGLGPGRGVRPGRLHQGLGAVATRRDPGEPRRMAEDYCPQPGPRSTAPHRSRGGQAAGGSDASARRRKRRRQCPGRQRDCR